MEAGKRGIRSGAQAAGAILVFEGIEAFGIYHFNEDQWKWLAVAGVAGVSYVWNIIENKLGKGFLRNVTKEVLSDRTDTMLLVPADAVAAEDLQVPVNPGPWDQVQVVGPTSVIEEPPVRVLVDTAQQAVKAEVLAGIEADSYVQDLTGEQQDRPVQPKNSKPETGAGPENDVEAEEQRFFIEAELELARKKGEIR